MPKYVTLYRFTDQGIRNVKASPDRLKQGIERAEAAGMTFHGAYYTQGEYDLVVISESDDDDAAAAIALTQAAMGNVRSVTMRAWDPDEFAKIVARMP